MKSIHQIQVFLACPGDVETEAQLVRDVIDEINKSAAAQDLKIHLEVRNWRTDSFPMIGKGDAQSVLNNQIAKMEDYDLFIGIMWNRFGTPTPRANSGTEEEFNRAYESCKSNGRPEIMFYFKDEASKLSTQEQLDQKSKVLAFRDKLEPEGSYWSYVSLDEFRKLVRKHIDLWIYSRNSSNLEPPQINSEPLAKTPPLHEPASSRVIDTSESWTMIGSHFFLATSVSEGSEGRFRLKVEVCSAEDDAALRSLIPGSTFGTLQKVQFAFQNVGGLAIVTKAERRSEGSSSQWDLELNLETAKYDSFSEMAYRSTSVDQIAEMRARHILLNEPPPSSGEPLDNALLGALVSGMKGLDVTESILPKLWESVKGDEDSFLPLARLWAVFHLLASNTCQYILELTLGPISNGAVHIRFRGKRHRRATNVAPAIIQVEGDCKLN